MASEFTNDQVADLRALEKARVHRGGPGFRAELQELITRLKDGGIGTPDTADPFLVQSKVLWDKGWGRELKFDGFADYLATIPPVPERPTDMPAHFEYLVLRDVRPFRSGAGLSVTKGCRMLGVAFEGTDETLIPRDGAPTITDLAWVWCQDGRMNRNRKPSDCRRSFVRPEVGAEALTGLFLFAQNPTVVGGSDDHVVDLPGSVRRGNPSFCAYLKVWRGRPGLDWRWGGDAGPRYGSASRWE